MSEEMKYEQAISRLDEIVALLDKSDLPLDEALSLYEEGVKLIALCTKKLNNAKSKILEMEKE